MCDTPVTQRFCNNWTYLIDLDIVGGWKRLYGKRTTKAYRRRNYKLAYVSYNPDEVAAATASAT